MRVDFDVLSDQKSQGAFFRSRDLARVGGLDDKSDYSSKRGIMRNSKWFYVTNMGFGTVSLMFRRRLR